MNYQKLTSHLGTTTIVPVQKADGAWDGYLATPSVHLLSALVGVYSIQGC